jgi:hypothetical protein
MMIGGIEVLPWLFTVRIGPPWAIIPLPVIILWPVWLLVAALFIPLGALRIEAFAALATTLAIPLHMSGLLVQVEPKIGPTIVIRAW